MSGCETVLEADLVNDINYYLKQKGILYSNELRMGIGIPDITMNFGANRRMKPLDDYFMVSILAYIEERERVTFQEIQDVFMLGRRRVRQYALMLASLQFVMINKTVIEILETFLSVDLGTTISIEAKLKDWKGACLQAQRYLCFSDFSYVALPEETVKNANSSMFLDSGIGLLAISGGNITEVIPAKKSSSCEFFLKYISTSKVVVNNIEVVKKDLLPNIFSPYV